MEVAILEKINSYRECFSARLSQLSNGLELLEKERENFFIELEATVQLQVRQMEASNQKALRELENRHDRDINDQQTLVMKMSMFREYDKQISQLQRELDYANRKIAKLINGNINESEQFETPTPISVAVSKNATVTSKNTTVTSKNATITSKNATVVSVSVPVDVSESVPVDVSVSVPVDVSESVSVPVDVSESVPVDVSESVPVDVSESVPVDVSAPEPVLSKRRKVTWKKILYYLDPETQEVFIDENGGEAVGRKEDKKIVLYGS